MAFPALIRSLPHWPFGARARLLRALDALAFYNDKGITYARDRPEQVARERACRLAKIRTLAEAVGLQDLPGEFVRALDTAGLAEDMTGRYHDLVRAHRKGHRPG